MEKPPKVEASGHHKEPSAGLPGLPDPEGHVGLTGQTAIGQQLLQGGVLPGQQAPGVHLPDKFLRGQGEAAALIVFLPKLLEAPGPGLFTHPIP